MKSEIVHQMKSVRYHLGQLKRLTKEAGLEFKAEVVIKEKGGVELQSSRINMRKTDK